MTRTPDLQLAVEQIAHLRWTEAEATAREMLAGEPDSGDGFRALAIALAGQHREDEALEAANEACRVMPEQPWNFVTLSRVRSALYDGPGAVEAARRAVELAPHDWWTHNALANACLTRLVEWDASNAYDPATALSAVDEAMRLAPASAGLHTTRGRALERLGRTNDAEREHRAALVLQPASPLPLNNIGWLRIKTRPIYAARHFSAALARDPQGRAARINLSSVIGLWIYRMIWILLWGGVALAALRWLAPVPVPALALAALGLTCLAGSLMFYRVLPHRSFRALWAMQRVRCFVVTIRFVAICVVDVGLAFAPGLLWWSAVVILPFLLVAEWKVNFSALERRFRTWRAR